MAAAQSTTVTVWYLAMDDPGQLVPPSLARPEFACAVEADPALNRALYHEIGADHHWVDLRAHGVDWWRSRLRDRVTLVARVGGEPVAYAELAPAPGGAVDLAYFGVRRQFQGRGIGAHLLVDAVEHAWRALGAARVTVNTCALDGAGALANYERRGFRVVREVEERRGLFSESPASAASAACRASGRA